MFDTSVLERVMQFNSMATQTVSNLLRKFHRFKCALNILQNIMRATTFLKKWLHVQCMVTYFQGHTFNRSPWLLFYKQIGGLCCLLCVFWSLFSAKYKILESLCAAFSDFCAYSLSFEGSIFSWFWLQQPHVYAIDTPQFNEDLALNIDFL